MVTVPVLHILLQDQVQLQHATRDCCVLHPSSENHPIGKTHQEYSNNRTSHISVNHHQHSWMFSDWRQPMALGWIELENQISIHQFRNYLSGECKVPREELLAREKKKKTEMHQLSVSGSLRYTKGKSTQFSNDFWYEELYKNLQT